MNPEQCQKRCLVQELVGPVLAADLGHRLSGVDQRYSPGWHLAVVATEPRWRVRPPRSDWDCSGRCWADSATVERWMVQRLVVRLRRKFRLARGRRLL